MAVSTKMKIPWRRHEAELPGPLPTTAEIESATTDLPSVYHPTVQRTVLLNGCFVVKYGPILQENEGHALLFLEDKGDIPTPRLYAMYREAEKLYIVTEYIPSHQLARIWPSLSEEEKFPITAQLRRISDSIRAIPSSGTFGDICGGPLPHNYFFSLEKDPAITGPFSNCEAVCRALILKSKKNWEEWGQRGWMNEFFDRHVSSVLAAPHESVFTHGDFQRKNILVREVQRLPTADGDDSQETRSFEVAAIVDWEDAGWYPAWWTYALCLAHFDWSDDWAEKLEHILDPFIHEATMMRMVAQDLDL